MRRQGFTLAEILITLGIIGVVASLALPAINTATTATRNKSALKKTMSTLNSGIRQNYAIHNWNFADRDSTCVDPIKDSVRDSRFTVCSLVNDNVEGGTYLNAVSTGDYGLPAETTYSFKDSTQVKAAFAGTAPTADIPTYLLPDGVIIGFDNSLIAESINLASINQDFYKIGKTSALGASGVVVEALKNFYFRLNLPQENN